MEKTLNKKYLRNYSYKDDSALKARKRLYLYANPKVDLENEIFKLINLKKVNRILDVGCGNGDLLIRLRKETGFKGELFGIDISKGILEPGIKQNMAEGLNIQFKVSYAEDLHFEDNYFDVIISKHVLFHLPQFQRAVDEAYRCLKPGGSFIIVLNSKKNKPKLLEFERFVYGKYGLSVKHGHNFLNMENVTSHLFKFSNVKSILFDNLIELTKPEPFVEYFASFKSHYTPSPKDAVWHSILKETRGFVQKEIDKKGKFIEKNSFGIVKAVK